MKTIFFSLFLSILLLVSTAWAQVTQRVVDIPTRPGVTQRLMLFSPDNPQAAVILFPGGHGGIQITPKGDFQWGEENFVVRTRQMFAAKGLLVAVVDAPSDRQSEPFLGGFRQKSEHVVDIKAVIAWVKQQADIPVWLVGTSRGTQSAAFIATQLPVADGGPDGLVLTSTIVKDSKSRPVPDMALEKIAIPVLVVHHKQDGCKHCPYAGLSRLMDKLTASPKKELLSFEGGQNRGDPCKPMAYHGFNGIEKKVVDQIADWIFSK